MDVRASFISSLLSQYPDLAALPRAEFEALVSENLLSPFVLELPIAVREKIAAFVPAFAALRAQVLERGLDREMASPHDGRNPGNPAITMSFDFHVTDGSQIKLIEVNTNASFMMLGDELYRSRGITPPVPFGLEGLRAQVLAELKASAQAFNRLPSIPPRVAIVDDNPSAQRLYLEFLVTRAWFKQLGWECDIRDVRDAGQEPVPDFIYNRSTDFYFETEMTRAIDKLYREGRACVSPNPFEYKISADKQRLIEYSQPAFLDSLSLSSEHRASLAAALPRSYDVTAANADEIWAQRKSLFIKPKREFGSKKAFRGGSISHKVFLEMVPENPIAQEFVPAPEVSLATPEGPQKFKYDLRCHYYGDQWVAVIARLYQGQVTNLKTKYGGFAPVVFR